MPHIIPGKEAAVLLTQSMHALGLTQARLGTLLMASRRTVSRWVSGRSTINAPTLARLAVAVHPTNATLAARLAAESGQTLESLGLVAPLAAPAPPRRAFPPMAFIADSVVCAAAEVMEAPPTVVREALRAAFARAQALGLSVEEMSEALSPPPAPPSGAAPPKGPASGKRTTAG
jgi:transcriptional regulator with XRE-family HTH domain